MFCVLSEWQHGVATARCPILLAKKVLVGPHDRDRIVKKARNGRGHEAIRGIPGGMTPEELREEMSRAIDALPPASR